MAEDSLKIKITLDAEKDIGKRIGQITKSLSNLNEKAQESNFAKFARGVEAIGKAAESIKSLDKSATWAGSFAESLKTVAEYGKPAASALMALSDAANGLDKSGIVKFGDALKQTANFLPELTPAKTKNFKTFAENTRQGLEELGMFDNKTYSKGINDAVKKLTLIGEGLGAFREGGLGIREVTANLRQLPESLLQFTKLPPNQYKLVAQNIREIAPAIQELGKNGAQLNEASKGIERLPKQLGQYAHADRFAGGIEGLKTTLGELSNAFTAFDKEEVKGFSPVVKALGTLPQALAPFTEENYSASIGNINSILSGLSDSINTFQEVSTKSTKFRTSVNALFNLRKAIDMFATMPEGAESSIKNIGKVLLGLNKAMEGLDSAPVTNLKKLATGLRYLERMGGDEKLWERISTGGERMKDFIKNVTDLPDDTVQKFGTLGTALEGIAQGYGKINQAQKTLTKAQDNPKSKKLAQTLVDTSVQMAKQTPKAIKQVATGFGKLFSLPFKGTIDHVKSQEIGNRTSLS